ncbi:MAG: DoxX family protein [bacterium]|nr:DoxX family protein [bacterium]
MLTLKIMFDILLIFSDWSIAFIRLVVGLIFLVHGWSKLKALKATQESFTMMGFKPGWFWGTLVSIVESLGGALIFLGVWVQFPALLLAIQMLVATIWKKKRGQVLSGGYELDLLLVAACLIIATMGAGAFALSGLFGY